MFTFTEFLTPYIQLSLCVTTSLLLRRNEQFFTNLLSKYFEDSSLVPIWKGCREKGSLKKIVIKKWKKRGKGMTLFKMWQKQMKQKAKNGRKKLVFENTKEKEKSRKRDCRFSKCNKCKWKITQKRNEKNRFWKYKKIRKRGCRFSKCNQHLRPLLLLHAIKELQSQQKHRNATLFFHKHQHART